MKGQLDDDSESEQTPDSSEDSDDSEKEPIKPQTKNKTGPRAGVSAEVYGQWNKKSDFKPPVVPKSD